MRECVKGGYSLSRKRVSPFTTPERKDEGSSPSSPHIGSLRLEELRSLRIAQPLAALLPYGCGIPLAGNRVRCTWLRHESLRVVTNRNRAFYREARVTFAWRQTACQMRHCFARRIVETGSRRKLGCTSTRWAERHPQGVCRIRKAAEPPTAAQQRMIEAAANRIATSNAATPRAGSCIPKA